ncbi:hypothetical protein E3V36_05535 [Candidatus Marinimicrobia bacterium MT.SAG.2]|nr:hypothetical protein E3V36_05535 [Candidatus Marinimicrobia bacterium MT.SAG.2]
MKNDMNQEILLEEYRVICIEMENQKKGREFIAIIALTAGLSILGYAMESNSKKLILYILPLMVFLGLYVESITRKILSNKTGTYIRYHIERHIPELKYFTRKTHYGIGWIWPFNNYLTWAIYLLLIAGNLLLIYDNGGFWYLIIFTVLSLGIIIPNGFNYIKYSPDVLYDKWKSHEKERLELIKKNGLADSDW